MKKLFTTILAVLAALPFVSAQEVPDYGCTPSHKKPLFSVQCFLTDDDESSKADRIKSGTEGIPISEIRPVDDIKVCSRLGLFARYINVSVGEQTNLAKNQV